jgi:hypothetical protein
MLPRPSHLDTLSTNHDCAIRQNIRNLKSSGRWRHMTHCTLFPIYQDARCYTPDERYLEKCNSADLQRPAHNEIPETFRRPDFGKHSLWLTCGDVSLCDGTTQNFLLSGCQCVANVMTSRALAILVPLIGPARLPTRPFHLESRRGREAVRYLNNHNTTVNKYYEYLGRANALTIRFKDFQLKDLIAGMFQKFMFTGTR